MAIKSKISDKDRNVLCPCGSGLKAKWCHADPIKLQLCNRVAQMYMMRLIQEERKKKGIDPYMFTCNNCGQGTDQPEISQIATATPTFKCPACGSTDLEKYVPPEPEPEEEPDFPDVDNDDEEPENKSIILEA